MSSYRPNDWQKPPEDDEEVPLPKERLSYKLPVIGGCISLCVMVASVLSGVITMCGRGSGAGYGGGKAQPLSAFAISIDIFVVSTAAMVGCVVWFVATGIVNSYRSQ